MLKCLNSSCASSMIALGHFRPALPTCAAHTSQWPEPPRSARPSCEQTRVSCEGSPAGSWYRSNPIRRSSVVTVSRSGVHGARLPDYPEPPHGIPRTAWAAGCHPPYRLLSIPDRRAAAGHPTHMTDSLSNPTGQSQSTSSPASTSAVSRPALSHAAMAASRELVENLGNLLSRGAIVGLVAGWGFILQHGLGVVARQARGGAVPLDLDDLLRHQRSAAQSNERRRRSGHAPRAAAAVRDDHRARGPVPAQVWMLALDAAVYGILLWVINFGAIRSARDIESRGRQAL